MKSLLPFLFVVGTLVSCTKEVYTYKVSYKTPGVKQWVTHYNVYPKPISEDIYQCMVEGETAWIENELRFKVDTLKFEIVDFASSGSYQKMPCQ